MKRPKLKVEQAMDEEISWSDLPQMPHCDARVLHKSEECVYCAKATDLQEERALLGVSNTGHANRAWPCPADQARSSASLNGWNGNRATTAKDLEEQDKYWADFRKHLEELDKD